MGRARRLGIVLLAFALPSSPARAQPVLWSRVGGARPSHFGRHLALSDDRDGDGVADVIVGAPYECGIAGGRLSVLSGASGAELLAVCGQDFDTMTFGGVASLDDFDGDGVADLVAASPYSTDSAGNTIGTVRVLSGADGSTLFELDGAMNEWFGTRLAAIGDVDGDGRRDFAVSATGADVTGQDAGRVYVLSGASGQTIRTHDGEDDLDALGISLTGLGDLDHDGVADYAVGAIRGDPSSTMPGAFYVYSGATGTLLLKVEGTGALEELGWTLADPGDLDQDGVGDVLVMAPGWNGRNGALHVYSGANGSHLLEIDSDRVDDLFGDAVAVVGDLNRDGVPEFLVGAPVDSTNGFQSGRADLFSGLTRRLLYRFQGGSDEGLGFAVAGGRDLDGDSIPDFLIGSPLIRNDLGKVRCFAGNDLYLQATPASVTAGGTLTLDTRGGEASALALLVIVELSGSPVFVPVDVSLLDRNGESSWSTTVPAGLAGVTAKFKAWAQDSPFRGGVRDSAAERVTIR